MTLVERAIDAALACGVEHDPRDCGRCMIEIVRAVVVAMRDPTDAMIEAGRRHDGVGDTVGRWQAMIDCALSEKE